jgi:hypothetical protein
MSDHGASRPLWIYAVCADEWPCPPARSDILDRYADDWVGAARQMTRLMDLAATDLGVADPTRLYKRFVRWTLGPDRACRVCGEAGHDALPGVQPRLIPCDRRAIPPIREPGKG